VEPVSDLSILRQAARSPESTITNLVTTAKDIGKSINADNRLPQFPLLTCPI